MRRTSYIPAVKARLYWEGELAATAVARLEAQQTHYLLDVMRARVGDGVRLFNCRDGEWLATITQAERRRCALEIVEQTRLQEAEPGPTLLFAPIKKSKLNMLVEKATELGVARLSPVQTKRTIIDRINIERLRAITIEAAEQCGRLTLPLIDEMKPLAKVLVAWPADHPLYAADETGVGQPLLNAVDAQKPAAFLIGPEGGFDPAEHDALAGQGFVRRVDLGPHILRAETAGLTVLALWRGAVAAGG